MLVLYGVGGISIAHASEVGGKRGGGWLGEMMMYVLFLGVDWFGSVWVGLEGRFGLEFSGRSGIFVVGEGRGGDILCRAVHSTLAELCSM